MKLKARDIIPGWPRSRSTMALWTGLKFMGKPYVPGYQYYRYKPLNLGNIAGTAEIVTPAFQYVTENALEEEYHSGQQEMVDNFRAEYRRLTHSDLQWLREGHEDPLQAAMKTAFYKQYVSSLAVGAIPVELALTIKNCAANDKPFWYRFRRASGENSVLFA